MKFHEHFRKNNIIYLVLIFLSILFSALVVNYVTKPSRLEKIGVILGDSDLYLVTNKLEKTTAIREIKLYTVEGALFETVASTYIEADLIDFLILKEENLCVLKDYLQPIKEEDFNNLFEGFLPYRVEDEIYGIELFFEEFAEKYILVFVNTSPHIGALSTESETDEVLKIIQKILK